MKKPIIITMLVPLALGLLSTALFLYQGGFGGGHGRFDQAIAYLEAPAILLGEHLP